MLTQNFHSATSTLAMDRTDRGVTACFPQGIDTTSQGDLPGPCNAAERNELEKSTAIEPTRRLPIPSGYRAVFLWCRRVARLSDRPRDATETPAVECWPDCRQTIFGSQRINMS